MNDTIKMAIYGAGAVFAAFALGDSDWMKKTIAANPKTPVRTYQYGAGAAAAVALHYVLGRVKKSAA
jgi:hypothetical protein